MTPKSKWVLMPSVRVFDDVTAGKEQVTKIAEETCEVYSAWEDYAALEGEYPDGHDVREPLRQRVREECCDAIQATCNLLAALGVTDLTDAMLACRQRNMRRGRITR